MSNANVWEVKKLIDLKTIMETCVTVILGLTMPETKTSDKIMIRKFLKRKAEKFHLITFVYMEVSERDRQTLNILKGTIEDYPKVYHIRGGNNILVAVPAATEDFINESFREVEKYYIEEMKAFQKQTNNKSKNTNTNTNKNADKESEKDINLTDSASIEEYSLESVDNEKNKKVVSNNHDNNKHDNNNHDNNVNISNNNNNNNKPEMVSISTGTNKNPELEKKKNLEKLVFVNKKYDDLKLELTQEILKRKKIEVELEKKREAKKKIEDDPKDYRKKLRKTEK
jgi:hypothetical protein